MLNKTCIIILLLVAGLFIGCSKGLEKGSFTALTFIPLIPSTGTPDTTAPLVLTNTPTGTGESVSTIILVGFNERMNKGTITSATFLVTASGVSVPGRVTSNLAADTFVFTPDSTLSNLTTYTVTISGSVTDRAGNALGADFTWTFATNDTNTLPAPGFDSPTGSYGVTSVSITYTGPTANIYFTTDGVTVPAPGVGTLWNGTPITISINTKIMAIACENPGYYDSAVVTGDFYFYSDQPTFSPDPPGTYHNDIDVEISPPSTDPGAMIFYEMTIGTISSPPADPPTPTTASTGYTGPIPVTGDFTVVKITAIAVSSGKCDSLPVSATYTIDYYQVGTPQFSIPPASGPFDPPQSVTITHDAGSTLYYTLDGSDPTDPMNPNLQTDFSAPVITVNETMTITAFAIMSGWRDSAVTSGTFVINPAIDSISPTAGSTSETALNITVNGARFQGAATLELRYGATVINASSTSWSSSTMLTGVFDLTVVATLGKWTMAVVNEDGGTATLVDGFRIYTDPSGIVSWWKLDGNYLDSGTAGNNGTSVETTQDDTDRFGVSGKARSPITVGDAIFKSTAGSLPVGSSPRTIMGWFRINNFALHDQYLFGYENWGTALHSMLYVSTGRRLVFEDSINGVTITGNTVLAATNRWYHSAVTYDGTTVTLYLDGMVEGTATATLTTTADRFYMFMREWITTTYPDAAIDDVMVLNQALSQSEIQQVAASSGYLLPPMNLTPSKGTYSDRVVLNWDSVPDATSYIVYRSSTLAAIPAMIGSATGTTYTDSTAVANDIYFYRVSSRNAIMESVQSKAEAGYAGTSISFTETFESGSYDTGWWDGITVVGSTPWAVDNIAKHDPSSYGLHVDYSTCSSSCGFTRSVRLTRTFLAPNPTVFHFSMWYMRGDLNFGEVRLYVNNLNPTDDTNWVPFQEEQNALGWHQLTANYIGELNGITSITLIYYDISTSSLMYGDDITFTYK